MAITKKKRTAKKVTYKQLTDRLQAMDVSMQEFRRNVSEQIARFHERLAKLEHGFEYGRYQTRKEIIDDLSAALENIDALREAERQMKL